MFNWKWVEQSSHSQRWSSFGFLHSEDGGSVFLWNIRTLKHYMVHRLKQRPLFVQQPLWKPQSFSCDLLWVTVMRFAWRDWGNCKDNSESSWCLGQDLNAGPFTDSGVSISHLATTFSWCVSCVTYFRQLCRHITVWGRGCQEVCGHPQYIQETLPDWTYSFENCSPVCVWQSCVGWLYNRFYYRETIWRGEIVFLLSDGNNYIYGRN